MRTKAIIFDIDGTAINSPHQKLPSQRLINAIVALENKFYICAATGRVWPFAKDIIKSMKLTDLCIISGGTQIIDPVSEKIIWQSNLSDSACAAALKIMREYNDFLVIYNEYTEDDYLNGGTEPKKVVIDGPVYILEQKFIPKDIAPEIVAKISKIKGVTCTLVTAQKPGVVDIHVTNQGATKEHTVARLLKELDVNKSDTIGFGDGHNDIHLFNAVNHKVAMDNAEKELREMADEVIGHVADDSFAEYLERLTAG